jgi:hypothetical protein
MVEQVQREPKFLRLLVGASCLLEQLCIFIAVYMTYLCTQGDGERVRTTIQLLYVSSAIASLLMLHVNQDCFGTRFAIKIL